MFKVGDLVREKSRGGLYEIAEVSGTMGVKFVGVPGIHWGPNFQLLKSFEGATVTNNPCIVEEVVTTTKRKIVDGSKLKLGGNTIFGCVRPYGHTTVTMNGSIYYASQIREFTKQLNEIAEVLEENETL